MRPGQNQRENYYCDVGRKQYRGHFYIEKGGEVRRVRMKLATFAELGLDDQGSLAKGGAQAERKLARQLDSLHREMERTLSKGEDERKRRGQSVKTLLQEWMDVSAADHAPGTLELFVQTANRFVDAVGDMPVSSFNERHRGRFITFLHEKGLAPATVNKYLRTIQSFFYWAKACGELEEVPSFKQIREPKKIPKILSEEDFSRLLAHIARKMAEARGSRERRYLLLHQRYAMIAAGTGARRNEIVMAPWSAVDFEGAVIVVRVSTRLAIKEKKEKEIPLAGFLLGYLIEQRKANPQEQWIMDDGRGRLAYTDGHSMTTAFARHLRAIGLGGRGIKSTHNFRALFATRLRNQLGVDVLTISGLLGHSTTAMTERYFSGEREKKEEAVKRLDQLAQDWHTTPASLPSP